MVRQRFFQFAPREGAGLEEFVISPANSMAHGLLVRILKQSHLEPPGRVDANPLLLVGGAATGKTRLIQGFRISASRGGRPEDLPVLDGRRVEEDLRKIPEERLSVELQARFQGARFLLMDHLEDLPEVVALHRALWNLFNLFHGSRRPIIAASRRAPRKLANLDAHLRSRFAWGLLVSLESPDDETRWRILQSLAAKRALRLRPELIRSILHRSPRDVASLERLVAALDALGLERGRRIDLRLVTEALGMLEKSDDGGAGDGSGV